MNGETCKLYGILFWATIVCLAFNTYALKPVNIEDIKFSTNILVCFNISFPFNYFESNFKYMIIGNIDQHLISLRS